MLMTRPPEATKEVSHLRATESAAAQQKVHDRAWALEAARAGAMESVLHEGGKPKESAGAKVTVLEHIALMRERNGIGCAVGQAGSTSGALASASDFRVRSQGEQRAEVKARPLAFLQTPPTRRGLCHFPAFAAPPPGLSFRHVSRPG